MTHNIDPICGMVGHIEAHDHWFCSEHCVKVFEKQEGISSETAGTLKKKVGGDKRIAWILIGIIILGGFFSWRYGVMQQFMGWFFVVVALLKLIDLPGFVEAYSNYDLITMQWKGRGWFYPFLELAIAIAFLMSFQVMFVAWLTLGIMIVGTIGVGKKVMKNEKFQCACLGTKLNVPLTNLTLVEDILMALMSVMLILGV